MVQIDGGMTVQCAIYLIEGGIVSGVAGAAFGPVALAVTAGFFLGSAPC
jgi:hypothetical protein